MPSSQQTYLILFFISISLNLACNKTEFQGGTPTKPTQIIEKKAEQCEPSRQYTGADFLFLIDNSGSMLDTDCIQNTTSGQRNLCSEPTFREEAILKAFRDLREITTLAREQGADVMAATSTMRVAKFTPRHKGESIQNMQDTLLFDISTASGSEAELAEKLAFTRSPVGDTPYANALNLALQWAEDLQDQTKTKKIILISDGLPTDRDPQQVMELAHEWMLPITTLLIDQERQPTSEQLAQHHDFMLKHYGPDWPSPAYQGDFEAYFEDLSQIQSAVSDQMISLAQAEELPAEIYRQVLSVTDTCLEDSP